MNKKALFIILLSSISLISCNKPSQPIESSSEESSASESSTTDSPLVNTTINCFSYVEDITIRSDDKTIYSKYQRGSFDNTKGISYYYTTINKISSLNENEEKQFSLSQVYYDGEYSYTYDSDSYYKRIKDSSTPNSFKYQFNFSLIKDYTLETVSYNNVYTGTISKESFSSFINKQEQSDSDVNIKVEFTSENVVSKLEYSYIKDSLSINYSYRFEYLSANLDLPTLVK